MNKMKTSLNIPEDLVKGIRAYNRKHPDKKIVMSGVATQALRKKFDEAEKSERE